MDSDVVLDLRFNKQAEVKFSRSEILHKIVTKLSSKKDLNSTCTSTMNVHQNNQPPAIMEKFPNSTKNPDINSNTQKLTNPPQNSNLPTTQSINRPQNLGPIGNLVENSSPKIAQKSPENQISVINFGQSCNSSLISSPTLSVEAQKEKNFDHLSQNNEQMSVSNGLDHNNTQNEPMVDSPILKNDLPTPTPTPAPNDKLEIVEEMPILECENETGSETTEFDESEQKNQKIEQNYSNFGYFPVVKRGRGRPRLNSMAIKSVKKFVKKGDRNMTEFLNKKDLIWGKRENQGQPPQRFEFLVISKEKKKRKFKMSNGMGYIINSITGVHRKRGRPKKIQITGGGNSNGNQVNGQENDQEKDQKSNKIPKYSDISEDEVVLIQDGKNNTIDSGNVETEVSDDSEGSPDGHFNLGVLLFDDKEFTDIDLVVGDEIFKAHKAVLASQSEYFSDLCKKVDRITFIPEVKPEMFTIILKFIYKGEVSIGGIENLIEIFNLAAKFKISKLLQLSINHLSKFREFSPEIGIRLLEIASNFGDSEEILQTILKSIQPIYKDIKKLEKWKEMVENPKYMKVIQRLVLILDS